MAQSKNLVLLLGLLAASCGQANAEKPAIGEYRIEARSSAGSSQKPSQFVMTMAKSFRLNLKSDGSYRLFQVSSGNFRVDSPNGLDVAKGKWTLNGDKVILAPEKGARSVSFLNYDFGKGLTMLVKGGGKQLVAAGSKTSETDASPFETWFIFEK